MLCLLYTSGELAAGARERPAERQLHAAGIAIIGVVDLRRQISQRSFGEANQAQQQPGLLIEIQSVSYTHLDVYKRQALS